MTALPQTRDNGDRYCPKCQKWKAPVLTKWKRGPDKKGWDDFCRACRKKGDKLDGQKADRIAMSKVMQMASGSILKRSNVPHTAEFLGEVMEVIGGPRKFAEEFNRSRGEALDGSMIRCQYDRAILQLIKDNTAMGGAKKPLDDMDLEELQRDLEAGIADIVLKVHGETEEEGDEDEDVEADESAE
jgi:hypothetical protein